MIRVVGPRLPHVVDAAARASPAGTATGNPAIRPPAPIRRSRASAPNCTSSEDRRAGTGRGGPPRRLPHQAAGNGFVGYPGKCPLDGHPERDDREVEQ